MNVLARAALELHVQEQHKTNEGLPHAGDARDELEELSVPGLRIVRGRYEPFVKREQRHPETEIAIPGADAAVTITYETALGRKCSVSVHAPQISIIPAHRVHTVHWQRESVLIAFFISTALVDAASDSGICGPGVGIAENYAAIDPVIRHLGLGLYDELSNGRGREQLYLESIALFLVTRALSRHGSLRSHRDLRARLLGHRLRRATEFMHDQFHRGISISEVAAEVHVSPFHFSRLFKRTTGRTPYRYLTSLRIDRAKQLLTDTETPIVDVSLAVGYESQSHFTTVFRRTVGVTPGAYRRLSARPLKTICGLEAGRIGRSSAPEQLQESPPGRNAP